MRHLDKLRGSRERYWRRFLLLVTAGTLCFFAGRATSPDRDPPSSAGLLHSPPTHAVLVAPLSIEAADPLSTTAEAWQQQWQQSLHLPSSLRRDEDLALLLEELATTRGSFAAALALAEPNLKTRLILISGVLRGWTRTAPRDAIDWFVTLDESSRRETSKSLMAGLTKSVEAPDTLVQVLCQADPTLTFEYGEAMLSELAADNRFAEILPIAHHAPAGHLEEWLTTSFRLWGERQPDEAIKAANTLTDSAEREIAWRSIATGWAAASPATAAAYCDQLPAGESRQIILGDVAQNWTKIDPAAAVAWLDRLTPSLGFDQGAAEIATLPAFMIAKPGAALRWAESIQNPDMRESAIGEVVRQWATQDPTAARQNALVIAGLDPAARQRLFESIGL